MPKNFTLLDQIPPPEIVRQLLAESIQQADLLRYLLRLARRKAEYAERARRAAPDRAFVTSTPEVTPHA